MQDNVNFAFVTSLLDVRCSMPVKIIEDCYFQRATTTQVEHIRQFLDSARSFTNNLFPYEYNYIIRENTATSLVYELQHLEPKDWRYYVLAFEGLNSKIHDLAKAANILENELEFNIQFIKHEEASSESKESYGALHNPRFTVDHFYKIANQFPISFEVLEDKHLQELSLIYQDIQQFDESKFPKIKQAIEMLDDLKHLPYDSKFNILGLFTIIEFLITHNPKDEGDSLTRQVSHKVPLLLRHFREKIDYSIFDKNTPETTIWKKIYAYRSDIAHGNSSNFSKELSVLKDSDNVQKFLKLIIKKLLRHALTEPQLYVDLKEC